MNTRADEAVEKYKNGYNCAQAVVCTYCDLVDGDEKTMFKATEALGIGMGNMEGTCGAGNTSRSSSVDKVPFWKMKSTFINKIFH